MIKDENGVWWTEIYVSSNAEIASETIRSAGLSVEIIGPREIKVLADDVGEVLKILARIPHRYD